MTLLYEILKWTETLPIWQRDAARRLFQKEEGLSQDDYNELVILLKAGHGLPVSEELIAEPFAADHLPAEVTPGETVVLKAMHELKSVNRIAPNQTLPFAETGITVIYGGNGSGKSGYARVMKKACRARDESEQVYPNAHDPAARGAIPSAKFNIATSGAEHELSWSHDVVSPEQLSTISVFDSKCARAYLTAENDVAYLPYGLDIVENLANSVLPELTQRLGDEIAGIEINTESLFHLYGDTAVGKLISTLSEKTAPESIKTLAIVTDEDRKRLGELNEALDQTDPMAKFRELSLSASRLKEFGYKVDKPLSLVSDQAIEKLRSLDVAKSTAEKAETQAAEALQSGEKLLPGTGEQIWKVLFESAKKYSTEVAYPEEEFPRVGEGSLCPLCQVTLTEAAGQRLQRFEDYIVNDVAKTAKDERKKLELTRAKIERADLSLGMSAAITEEINLLDDALPSLVIAYEESINTRRKSMLSALDSHDWSTISTIVESPRKEIRNLAANQLRASRTFVKAADEDKKKKLTDERDELVARQNLSKCVVSVLTLLQRMKKKAALKKCKETLKTRPISDKSKEFASKAVTVELKKALENEFNHLGIGHIKTTLKEKSKKGRMFHQLLLDLPTSHSLDAILSEGEQRAIALGSFLAELALANHSCGIVFDDPVSSLDHKRRGKVAKRLAREAKQRQVIVFTHDTVFLHQLRNECENLGSNAMISFLEWDGYYSGLVSEGLPWVHKSFGERIDSLEKAQKKFEKLPWPPEPSDDLAGQMVRQYSFLRATIERVVQDHVLNGTVQRFRDYIDIKKLNKVIGLDPEEVREINRLTQRCHDIVEAHDPSSAKDEPPPTPDELKQDLNDLKQVIEMIKNRWKK